MGQCQPFGSLLEVGMGDNQHVRRLHAVQVLGGHFVQQRGCGNAGRRFGVERHVGFHPVGLVHETHGLSRTFHRYLLRLLRVGHVPHHHFLGGCGQFVAVVRAGGAPVPVVEGQPGIIHHQFALCVYF